MLLLGGQGWRLVAMDREFADTVMRPRHLANLDLWCSVLLKGITPDTDIRALSTCAQSLGVYLRFGLTDPTGNMDRDYRPRWSILG